MMLDGAQVLRLGRDLIVNVAQGNHRMAVDWLERHSQGRYRLHRVWRMADSHIDSMLLALRPGVFLARHEGLRDLLPEALRSWKFLIPPPPEPGDFPVYDEHDLVLTSPYIDLNVLSIDKETVLVNEDCTGVRKMLEDGGLHHRAGPAPAPAYVRRRLPLLHPGHPPHRRLRGLPVLATGVLIRGRGTGTRGPAAGPRR